MENIQTKQKKKKGFTLIELIIVIAILGILALIAIPKFGAAQKDAKIKADIATGKTIANQAAKMIGEGKIELTGDASKEVADLVGAEMQGKTIPKSQVAGENFKVNVDKDGEITVSTSKGEVYPTQDGEYKTKK